MIQALGHRRWRAGVGPPAPPIPHSERLQIHPPSASAFVGRLPRGNGAASRARAQAVDPGAKDRTIASRPCPGPSVAFQERRIAGARAVCHCGEIERKVLSRQVHSGTWGGAVVVRHPGARILACGAARGRLEEPPQTFRAGVARAESGRWNLPQIDFRGLRTPRTKTPEGRHRRHQGDNFANELYGGPGRVGRAQWLPWSTKDHLISAGLRAPSRSHPRARDSASPKGLAYENIRSAAGYRTAVAADF